MGAHPDDQDGSQTLENAGVVNCEDSRSDLLPPRLGCRLLRGGLGVLGETGYDGGGRVVGFGAHIIFPPRVFPLLLGSYLKGVGEIDSTTENHSRMLLLNVIHILHGFDLNHLRQWYDVQ